MEIQQLTFCVCRLIGDFTKEEMADQFFTNIGNKIESFFGGGDALPWTDSEMIAVSLSSFLSSVEDVNPILAEHGVLVNDFSLHLSYEWILVISTCVHEFDLFVTCTVFRFLYYNFICMQTCEHEAGVSGGDKSESIMRLAWALVHSRNAPDVQRGIAMLEGLFHPCVKSTFMLC